MARETHYNIGTSAFAALAFTATCALAQMPPRPPVPGADAPGMTSLAAKPDKPAVLSQASSPAAQAVAPATAPASGTLVASHPAQPRVKDSRSIEYTELQMEEAIWQKRANIADLKKKAAGWDQPVGTTANLNGPLPGSVPGGTASAAPAPAPAPAPVPARKASRLDTVYLTGTSAFNGKRSAAVSVDGSPIDVSVGTPLVDGWVVAEISESAVKLANGKQVHWLRK